MNESYCIVHRLFYGMFYGITPSIPSLAFSNRSIDDTLKLPLTLLISSRPPGARQIVVRVLYQ